MKGELIDEALVLIRTQREMAGRPWDRKIASLFLVCLNPMDDQHGWEAVAQAVTDEEFPVMPGHIKKWYEALSTPTEELRSVGDAWEEACRLRSKYGDMGAPHPTIPGVRIPGWPPIDDPALKKTLKYLGGWQVFCEARSEDRSIDRAQFERRYKEAVEMLRRERKEREALAGGVERPALSE